MLTVDEVVKKVRERLRALSADLPTPVELEDQEPRLEDDGWLYLVVQPAKPGVRASDYAFLMARVEKELREEGIDKIVLVPALPDF